MFNLSSGNTSEMLAVGICTWWFGMMEGGRGVLGRGTRNLRDAWVAKDMEIGLGPRVASGTFYFIAWWANTRDTLGLWAPTWFWFMHICIMLPYTEQLGSFVCMYYVRACACAHTPPNTTFPTHRGIKNRKANLTCTGLGYIHSKENCVL